MLLLLLLLVFTISGAEGAECGGQYPPRCKCELDSHEKVRSVNCTDAALSQFPDIDVSVRTLDLSGNQITHLRRRDGGKVYSDLLSLTLNDCQIEMIEEGFFQQFPAVNIVKLKGNKLTKLPDISSSSSVILDMTHNLISKVNNFSNPTLHSLYLDYNSLTVLGEHDLTNLPSMKVLTMMFNSIQDIHEDALSPAISHLSLGSNKLQEVPVLNKLSVSLLSLSIEKNNLQNFDNVLKYPNLENCTFASNAITRFPKQNSGELLSSIRVLVLSRNSIDKINRSDFEMFPSIYYLELSENAITHIPDHCFSSLPLLRKLDLSENSITSVSETSLKRTELLETLYLQHNSLLTLTLPLKHLHNLHELDVTGNKLTEPPHCAPSLLLLYISENNIESLKSVHFKSAQRLKDLDVSNNKISKIEGDLFQLLPELERLHIQNNLISNVEMLDLSTNIFLTMLNLGNNGLTHIPDNFLNNTSLTTLSLPNNQLTKLTNTTLAGVDGKLRFLDLSFNDLEELSHVGLSAVESLFLEGNVRLVSNLPREGLDALRRATVPFSVMCCWFKKIKKNSQKKEEETKTDKFVSGHWKDEAPIDYKATFITAIKQPYKGIKDSTDSYITQHYVTGTETLQFHSPRLLELKSSASASLYTHTPVTMTTSYPPAATTTNPPRPRRDAPDLTLPATTGFLGDFTVSFEDLDKDGENGTILQRIPITDELHCTPEPDAFNPCEDLIGNWVLRMGVWIVCTLAVLGNLTLFTVTLLSTNSTKKFTPTRFLIVNLSFSDLLTGIYLMMLAAVDAKTYGFYEDYAVDWQNGPGCQIAGFMVTFSSELSVFTLTMISVERMVTIIHYSNPYKHLKTRHIALAMLLGWLISATAGAFPLLGFSDYSLVAICLPFQNSDGGDLALILSLMVINTIAVIVIIYCYLTIFCNVRHLQKPLDNADFRETLRMALIILTDVLCWLPIVVCGVSAALGKPLITTSNAKILVVFFLPLNACANPFLYSLSRAGFKKDFLCVLDKIGLCKQAYYIASRRKSGMDLDLKKKLQAETKELRKPSQDSTSTTRSSSGYSSDSSYIKQLVNQFKSNIGSLEETRDFDT